MYVSTAYGPTIMQQQGYKKELQSVQQTFLKYLKFKTHILE